MDHLKVAQRRHIIRQFFIKILSNGFLIVKAFFGVWNGKIYSLQYHFNSQEENKPKQKVW